MIKIENDCVDCGFPCQFNACPYYRVKHYYCDECGNEEDTLYQCDDRQLCENCLIQEFPVVE